METLVIINYCIANVDIYNISKDIVVDDKWFKDHGYNVDEIDWMFTDNLNINIKNE